MPVGTRPACLILAAFAVAFPARGLAQELAVPASGRAAIVSQTNAYRQARGLAPLRESASADRVAQAYATYLARTRKTGHGADGRNPAQRLRAAGIKYCKFLGENWHRSWTRPNRASTSAAMSKAMSFWKQSPGHERALRSASTEIGVGVAGWRHGNQWYYVSVQMFFDTSCFRKAPEPLPPSLPHRNPARTEPP
jgi:uncharacterized protein YkwD